MRLDFSLHFLEAKWIAKMEATAIAPAQSGDEGLPSTLSVGKNSKLSFSLFTLLESLCVLEVQEGGPHELQRSMSWANSPE